MKSRNIDFQPANVQDLKDAVSSRGVTLVLGAGVSQSRNLPDWGELTSKIWEETFETKYPLEGSEHPFAHQFALELIEEELHTTRSNISDNRDPFVEALRGALYDDVDNQIRGKPGDTLGVIAKLLRREAKEAKKRIRSVITFNVDSLLEEEVHRYLKFSGPLVWPVSRASDDPLKVSPMSSQSA